MTNEEIALDILANNKKLRTQTPPIRGVIRDALIDIANRKDQQFKAYLEKKKAELSARSDLIGLAAPFHAKLINEIINELYKED